MKPKKPRVRERENMNKPEGKSDTKSWEERRLEGCDRYYPNCKTHGDREHQIERDWARDGFRAGADFGYQEGRKDERARAQKLVEALECLTNSALANLKPLPSQVEAGFNALAEWQASETK